MAFCEDCGSPLSEGVAFCENCGAKISSTNNVISRGLRKVALCATVCGNTKRPVTPSICLIMTGLFCLAT